MKSLTCLTYEWFTDGNDQWITPEWVAAEHPASYWPSLVQSLFSIWGLTVVYGIEPKITLIERNKYARHYNRPQNTDSDWIRCESCGFYTWGGRGIVTSWPNHPEAREDRFTCERCYGPGADDFEFGPNPPHTWGIR